MERLRAGDTTIDYASLRMAYAHSSKYNPSPMEEAGLRHRVHDALATSDLPLAFARAESLVVMAPLDIEARVIASFAAQQSGDSTRARFEGAVARGLIQSLDGKHRGQSLSAPVVVIRMEEEEAFGRSLGLTYTGTYKTTDCVPGICDAVVFRSPDSQRDTTVYFDITLPAKWMLERGRRVR